MYLDSDGNFPLLIAGFIVGALVSTAVSIMSQGFTNGWDSINMAQVALDGALGGIGGLLAFTGIGALGSAFISGGLGFVGSVGGDLISSNGDWDKVNWTKAGIMTVVNFGLGFGAGAKNSKAIGKDLWGTVKNTKVGNIFSSASARANAGQLSQKGFQGVMNLYGNKLAAATVNAMPGVMASRISSSFFGIGASGVIDLILNIFM